jgi:hypothetical protein
MIYRIKRRIAKTMQWLHGVTCWYCVLPWFKFRHKKIHNLNMFERRITSQNWEDGIIHAIFEMIGTTNKYYVEFGAEDGTECNTRYVREHNGWSGLLMDGGHECPSIGLQKEFITAENIELMFAKYNVPKHFDLLSIDIDGNDYWVWNAVTHYDPRVVVIEYNACLPYAPPRTIPYDTAFQWDKTDYYGASLSALVSLGIRKGYTLVATDSRGVNAFFIKNDLAKTHIDLRAPEELYRPAMFKGRLGGHPHDPHQRPWQAVS